MVEPLDFTVGTVVGTVIGVIASFVANYLTEVFRERKRHDRVLRAFIKELTLVGGTLKAVNPYKSAAMGTPVFSKLITELPLLKEPTAEELLNTYYDIRFYLRPKGSMTMDDLKELEKSIETSIALLRKEVKHKPRKSKAQF